jgi:uncharacterized metal-binding protein YceD (DUF177 family)
MTDPISLPSEILRLSEQRARQDLTFRVEPDEQGRAAVAAFLRIPAIRKLRFEGRLTPVGRRDWHLSASLGATVVQDCVVTLAPVTTRIDEEVVRRYLSDFAEPGPGEVEMPEDDTAEELPASLDLADVMIEALSLALPPFPRASGADLGEVVVTEPGAVPLTSEGTRPFADLSALRDRLANKGDPQPD